MEECNENIDEAKLTEIALFEHKNKCACYYTVFIVLSVIVLKSALGLVLILAINTSSVIKKMFLYMIIFIRKKFYFIFNHIK